LLIGVKKQFIPDLQLVKYFKKFILKSIVVDVFKKWLPFLKSKYHFDIIKRIICFRFFQKKQKKRKNLFWICYKEFYFTENYQN